LGGIILLILTILWDLCGWVVSGTIYQKSVTWVATLSLSLFLFFSFWKGAYIPACFNGLTVPWPSKLKTAE
jgi:hypothetical protein